LDTSNEGYNLKSNTLIFFLKLLAATSEANDPSCGGKRVSSEARRPFSHSDDMELFKMFYIYRLSLFVNNYPQLLCVSLTYKVLYLLI
jgi:hypothetical protein